MCEFGQVLKLKQKIEAERGKDYPTENQKLIYAGKFLYDENHIEHNLKQSIAFMNHHLITIVVVVVVIILGWISLHAFKICIYTYTD